MARYIEANDLVRAMTLQANRTAIGEISPPHLSYSEMLEIIADAPTADVVPKSEVERLIALNSQLEEKLFEERGKVERLHGILLQFTDIVHKWGTKNNIDTSEISLVPIMNEEADNIIQKANQEVAREIFEEIEKCMEHDYISSIGVYNGALELRIAELKKKYTEGEK